MSDFDIDGARKAGYSDAEIADYIGKQRNFDVAAARKAGYSDADLLDHFTGAIRATPTPEPAAREPIVASAVFNNRPMSVPAKVKPGPPTSQQPTPQPPALPWSDLPGNIPASAGRFANALAQPFIHPVDTYKGLQRIAGGLVTPPEWLVGKETPEQKDARIAPAKAVGDYFSDRYGGMRNIRNTIISDPVGFAADVSMPLTGGGNALARAPGIVGKVGEVAQTAGRFADPVTAAGKAVGGVAKVAEPVVSNALGLSTGSGASSVRTAARAGAEGGKNAEAFQKAMRGNSSIEDTVALARSAVDQVRKDRSDAYKSGMAELSKDKTVMDFSPIEDAVDNAAKVGSFKGVTVEPKAAGIVSDMRKVVEDWKKLDPAEYHTPEGIDALKRTLGNFRDSAGPGTPERVAADRVYNAVRKQLVNQAPDYAKTMEAYSTASDKLKEVTKTLSLGEKATGDTAGRKLLSATRDNANTNYGQRVKLIDQLAEHEPTLPYAIAGHAMNALAPQGIIGRGGLVGMVLSNPLGFLKAPAFSPRVVGEGAYYAGKAGGMAGNALNLMRVNEANARTLGRGAYQAGRLQEAR
jgi:hypothetical protein